MADYPQDLLNQLKPDDEIIIVQELDLVEIKPGFFGPSKKVLPKAGFIAVTVQRLVVKASKLENVDNPNKISGTIQTINVPISKVSSITVESKEYSTGCWSKTKDYVLVLNVQGGIYQIYTGSTPKIAEQFVKSYLDIEDKSE